MHGDSPRVHAGMASRCLGLVVALLAAGPALAQHTHAPAAPMPAPAASIDVPLDAAALGGLTRSRVTASAHGQALDCNGVALIDLLRKAGAMPAEPLRGGMQLGRRVEVLARDGYRVTFSLGELDPSLGNRQVFLVDQCDGKPLAADSGPLRLIVPEDSRPARGIRQIERITVLSP